MTITAQSIAKNCVTIAQDPTSVRWPIDEVCEYFNWAQREVVQHRPDASQVRENVTVSAGAKQTLPAGAIKLLDIHANASGGAMRLISREVLDAQMRGWRSTSAAAPYHFMYDPRTPLVFEIYPPASGSTTVDASYSKLPTDISIATAGGTYTNVTGNLGLPDIFAGPVTDFILYRMYSKDAEYAGNMERAVAHYTAAANALGVELKGTIVAAPVTQANPNHPGASRQVT